MSGRMNAAKLAVKVWGLQDDLAIAASDLVTALADPMASTGNPVTDYIARTNDGFLPVHDRRVLETFFAAVRGCSGHLVVVCCNTGPTADSNDDGHEWMFCVLRHDCPALDVEQREAILMTRQYVICRPGQAPELHEGDMPLAVAGVYLWYNAKPEVREDRSLPIPPVGGEGFLYLHVVPVDYDWLGANGHPWPVPAEDLWAVVEGYQALGLAVPTAVENVVLRRRTRAEVEGRDRADPAAGMSGS